MILQLSKVLIINGVMKIVRTSLGGPIIGTESMHNSTRQSPWCLTKKLQGHEVYSTAGPAAAAACS